MLGDLAALVTEPQGERVQQERVQRERVQLVRVQLVRVQLVRVQRVRVQRVRVQRVRELLAAVQALAKVHCVGLEKGGCVQKRV